MKQALVFCLALLVATAAQAQQAPGKKGPAKTVKKPAPAATAAAAQDDRGYDLTSTVDVRVVSQTGSDMTVNIRVIGRAASDLCKHAGITNGKSKNSHSCGEGSVGEPVYSFSISDKGLVDQLQSAGNEIFSGYALINLIPQKSAKTQKSVRVEMRPSTYSVGQTSPSVICSVLGDSTLAVGQISNHDVSTGHVSCTANTEGQVVFGFIIGQDQKLQAIDALQ